MAGQTSLAGAEVLPGPVPVAAPKLSPVLLPRGASVALEGSAGAVVVFGGVAAGPVMVPPVSTVGAGVAGVGGPSAGPPAVVAGLGGGAVAIAVPAAPGEEAAVGSEREAVVVARVAAAEVGVGAHAVLVVDEQARVWYFPVPQVEQVEHAVLDVPEHSPLSYLPVPQVAQVAHV